MNEKIVELKEEIDKEQKKGSKLVRKMNKYESEIQKELNDIKTEIEADPKLDDAQRKKLLEKIEQQELIFQQRRDDFKSVKEEIKKLSCVLTGMFVNFFSLKKTGLPEGKGVSFHHCKKN